MYQGEHYNEPTWNQSVPVYHSDPPRIYKRLTSQRHQSSLSACGSTIPKSAAIPKDLKPILGSRRARSARVATVFVYEDNDLVGDLPLELVRAGGGKLAVSEITSYSDVADVEAGSSVKGIVSASSPFCSNHQTLYDKGRVAPRLPSFMCPAPAFIVSSGRRPLRLPLFRGFFH